MKLMDEISGNGASEDQSEGSNFIPIVIGATLLAIGMFIMYQSRKHS